MMFAYSRVPKLDLHGEYAVTAYTTVHNFLQDQIKLKQPYVILIHGKGTGKLKEEVHKILSKEPNVLEYYLDSKNLGQTIIHLKVEK